MLEIVPIILLRISQKFSPIFCAKPIISKLFSEDTLALETK